MPLRAGRSGDTVEDPQHVYYYGFWCFLCERPHLLDLAGSNGGARGAGSLIIGFKEPRFLSEVELWPRRDACFRV